MKAIKRLAVFLFVFFFLLVIPATLAQDGAVSGIPDQVIPLEDAAGILLNAIAAIVAGGLLQAPITTFLVAVQKRIPFFNEISGQTLQLVTGGLLTVAFWLAVRVGFEAEFRSLADLIVVAGPALLNLLATFSGSSAYYHMANRAGDPVFGYKRSTAGPAEYERWYEPLHSQERDLTELQEIADMLRRARTEEPPPTAAG